MIKYNPRKIPEPITSVPAKMFHIVLYQPEIPPNTGNIIRLCANTGANLHLIQPMGFDFTHRKLKRAGLDYHEFASVQIHNNFEQFNSAISPRSIYACSTKGKLNYSDCLYQAGDAFVFGPETRGLPDHMLINEHNQHVIRIPMLPHSRSINLSNTVAIILYEAWRQNSFSQQIIK